jgi:ATP-dependent protease Clp ATPase subunit
MPRDGDLLNPCSFCGQDRKQVKALIAGPGVFICDVCIDRVHEVLAVTGRTASTPIAFIQQVNDETPTERCSFCGKRRHDETRTERCSFCGKRRHRVSAMASAGDTRICNECLQQCREIRRERLNSR